MAYRVRDASGRCNRAAPGDIPDTERTLRTTGHSRDERHPGDPVAGSIRLGENAARLAILALTGYALLPIVRNTYAGIRSVDPALIDVAQAMGMTDSQRLWKVELPLGASVILAGLRTATVTCVGVATIAAAIGAGGLGELIFRGVASVDNGLVLAGAIPAAMLALVADGALGWAEKRLAVRR